MAHAVFVFKVALAGRKSIWRQIALRGNQTLDDLHEAIYDAFDRYDEHLYSFYFPRPGVKKFSMSAIRNALEYACPFTCEDEGPFGDPDMSNAAKTKLISLKLQPKQVFYYLFDFGDEWWHEIAVEKVDAAEEKGEYPRVLESRGASPPQYPDMEDEDEEDEDDEE
jgi:hypothetical protein